MTIKDKIRFWFAKQLIAFGKLQQVKYDADYLNPLIETALPHHETFPVPAGKAELTVLTVTASIGEDNEAGLNLSLLCALEIISVDKLLYRAHINADINAFPFYHQVSKSIRISKAHVTQLSLIQDEYLMIDTPKDIVKSLTPNIFKGLLDVTIDAAIDTAKAVVSELTPPVKDYLEIFTQLNKQKVLDFHRGQIQQLLTELIEQGDLCYQLEPDDFEEQLFALYGKQMDIENNHLVFKFS